MKICCRLKIFQHRWRQPHCNNLVSASCFSNKRLLVETWLKYASTFPPVQTALCGSTVFMLFASLQFGLSCLMCFVPCWLLCVDQFSAEFLVKHMHWNFLLFPSPTLRKWFLSIYLKYTCTFLILNYFKVIVLLLNVNSENAGSTVTLNISFLEQKAWLVL